MNTKEFTTAKLSRKVGYVFQNPDDQIFHGTVGGEIEFGPNVLGFEKDKVKEMVRFASALVNLQEEMDENPKRERQDNHHDYTRYGICGTEF